MTVSEQQATAFLRETTAHLRAEISVALGDLQVILLRELATRLKAEATPAGDTLPLEATADQLEASVREARHTIRRHRPPTG